MKDSQNLKKKQTNLKKISKSTSGALGQLNAIIKKHETDFHLLLIPSILLVIFAALSIVNNALQRQIEQSETSPAGSVAQLYPYPFVGDVQMPELSAKAAIITDADSQVVLFSKNPNLRFSMASTTKIMTALTALDYYAAKDVLMVKTAGVEGSTLNLYKGERIYFEDLLYMMLLPSANDAAMTIADNYPGGREAFVKQMNTKAFSLHLVNTHFSEPTGLNDDENYTTVVDMARLASAAIKDKRFTQVTSTREKTVINVDRTRQYTLTNLNKLLGQGGVTGIKTGTTEGAGEVLVTSTVEKGHTFIIVVMNSTQRFVDTQALLTFITENVKYILPTMPR